MRYMVVFMRVVQHLWLLLRFFVQFIWQRRLGKFVCLCFMLLFAFFVAALLTPLDLQHVQSWAISPVLEDRDGAILHARLSQDEEWSMPIPLAQMGKWLPIVAVAVEDRRFYYHMGVDPLGLARAISRNIATGTVVSGASTISSQVIRLSYPRTRRWQTKITEFLQAVHLEMLLSKDAILELYLNRAPFGGPVRGVAAASMLYFNKRAQDLSLAESALLIGMLKGPTAYRPDKNPEKIKERRNLIITMLQERGLVSERDAVLALWEPLPSGRGALPAKAWHFSEQVFKSLPRDYWNKVDAKPVRTGLDVRAQQLLESALRHSLLFNSLPAHVTAAGGIVDNKTGMLIAYVGNAKFEIKELWPDAPSYDASPAEGGQVSGRFVSRAHWVDCGLAPRSPGSVLKPFIFLEAFEQGILTPASLLADTPLRLSGQAPRNFSRLYKGPVSAHVSLAESLNAPSVRVLRMVGGDAALQRLRNFGFSYLTKRSSHYGDSLVIGGCEVSLMQLFEAYAALANMGLRKPVRLTERSSEQLFLLTRRVASQEASYLIAETLRDSTRLGTLAQVVEEERQRPIAFKTGTSYGMRDAWTAAYTPDYTVVVWLGVPEGWAHHGLVGLVAATPPVLRVIRALDDLQLVRQAASQDSSSGVTLPSAGAALPVQGSASQDSKPNWFEAPLGLHRELVCSVSGMPVNPACYSGQMAWRISGVTHIHPCTLHVVKGGEVTIIWPPELEQYAKRLAMDFTADYAKIVSPRNGAKLELTPAAQNQRFSLRAEGTKGMVYWFMDGEYIGETEENGLFWTLVPGKHVLSLIDSEGRTASIRFSVLELGKNRIHNEDIPLLFLQE